MNRLALTSLKLCIAMALAALCWACAFEQEVAPVAVPGPKPQLLPLAQTPTGQQALQGLFLAFPAGKQAMAHARTGFMPSAWGLVDTTRVLTILAASGKAHYTFKLQPNAVTYGSFKRLLLYEAGNGFKGLLLHYTPAAGWRPQQPFSGQLSIQDLQGQLVSNLALHNGEPMGTGRAATNERSMESQSCLQDINWHQDCSEGEVSTATGVTLPSDLQNCMWVLELDYGVCDASTVGAPGEAAGSPGTTVGPGGGGSGGSGSVIIEEPPAEDPETPAPLYTGPVLDLQELMLDQWVEHIDDSELAECLKNVLNNLKEVQGGGPLSDILKTFDINQFVARYNWKLNTYKDTTSAEAFTEPHIDRTCNCIITQFNLNRFRHSSDLFAATVLIHEMVHAYLNVQFEFNKDSIQYNYPELFYGYGLGLGFNNAQHEEFTRSFIGQIGQFVQAYAAQKGYEAFDSLYYADLAWVGLSGTDAYMFMDPYQQARIKNTIDMEQLGAVSNMGLFQPKGKAINCNLGDL